MPVNKGKIAKNAIALYVRLFVVLVISLYSARVVLQELGISDYGTYNVVAGVVIMLSFLSSSLSQGVQRFFNFQKGKNNNEELCKVYWSSLIIMLVVAIILIIVLESVGLWFLNYKLNIPCNRFYAANWVFQLSIITILIHLLQVPFNALIVSNEDFGIYTYVSIGYSIGNLLLVLTLSYLPYDKLITYGFLMMFLAFLNFLALVLICNVRYKSIRPLKHTDAKTYKGLLSFSGWNILGVSTYTLGTQGVNMILNVFFGTIVNAARGIAFQISAKVDEFINNIQQAMNPQIVQLYAKGEKETVINLVYDNMRWNFSLYWLIALPLIFEIDYILELWLGDVPEYTAIFTIIVVLRSLLKCFERPINAVNFAVGKMMAINIFASICVLSTTILMCVLFAVGFPPYWAFLLDCLSIALCILYYMLQARRHGVFRLRPFALKILLPILLVMFITVSGTILSRQVELSGFSELIFTCICTTTLSSVSLLYVLYTKENRKQIKKLIVTKILRRK